MVLLKWLNNSILGCFTSNFPSSKTEENYDEDTEEDSNYFHCPDEILIEILSRVPADRLLVFKRVCSHWRVLISSYGFLKLQIKRAKEEAISKPAILVDDSEHASILKISSQGTWRHDLQNLRENLKQRDACFRVDSCDGLLLFSLYRSGCINLIVNPITQETRLVTGLGLVTGLFTRIYDRGSTCIFFDRFEDDYKLLHLAGFYIPLDVGIYSFKRDQSRKLISSETRFCFQPNLEDPPVVVADSLHWIRCFYAPSPMMVLVFKIETRDFSLMPFPNGIESTWLVENRPAHDDEHMQLIEKDGQLGLCHKIVKRKVIEIWFLQHYGNWESWARKFTVDLQFVGFGRNFFHKKSMKPIKIVSFRNDKYVLLAISNLSTKLYMYNLKTRRSKLIRCGTFVCTPLTLTLLSPNGVYSTL